MRIKRKEESENEVRAFLGDGTEFTGKLVFKGCIRIDGNFNGNIMGNGLLISGEGSRIEGDIHVDDMVISGDVFGTIEAQDNVEIESGGKFFGDITCRRIVVQKGAIIEGNCSMRTMTEPFRVAGIDDGLEIEKRFLEEELSKSA